MIYSYRRAIKLIKLNGTIRHVVVVVVVAMTTLLFLPFRIPLLG